MKHIEILKGGIVFLSNPYSNINPEIIEERYQKCLELGHHMIQNDVDLISPILIGHQIVKKYVMLESDWNRWEKYCKNLINISSTILVFKLDGWEQSTGVKAEIDYAKSKGKRILYIDTNFNISQF